MSHHSQLATTPRYLISSTLVVSAAAAARARDWRWLGVPRVTTLLRGRPRGRMATWIDASGGQQVFGEQRARVSTIRHGLADGARWQLCTAETPSGHKFVMIDVGVITKRWSRTQVPLLFLSALLGTSHRIITKYPHRSVRHVKIPHDVAGSAATCAVHIAQPPSHRIHISLRCFFFPSLCLILTLCHHGCPCHRCEQREACVDEAGGACCACIATWQLCSPRS